MIRAFMLISIVLAAACASTPLVPLSQPHGLVVPQFGAGADATFGVAVVEINGVNLPGDRLLLPLAPGRHELVVIALEIDEPTLLTAARDLDRAIGIEKRQPLVIEVEEGMRYTVAAHVYGPTTADWRPVLVRVDPIE